MAKISRFPVLFDEVMRISITKLKEFGYLKPESIISGRLIWSRRGEEVGSINALIDMKNTLIMI